jgi:sarcosine oxidase, subunit beta
MTLTADVIVIGGGIHGCSTALHLALRGVKAIVIEKDHVGRHASGVNAGGVRQLARQLPEVPLSVASMEIWERIRDVVDDDCGFEAHGQVLIAESETELDAMRARVEDLRLRGFMHEELIDRTELKVLVPAVADHCPGGVVSRRDGAADPFRTTHAIARKAIALGARVIEGAMVVELTRRGGAWRLVTTSGTFEAPNIVNAAGAWADQIAAQLGESVPLEVIAPMLMITARVPPFIRPVVILRGRKLSFKQLANGTVLIGGGHLGQSYRGENRTELDWRGLAQSARTVWELFPAMRGTTIVRAWAGTEARMPDELPVIGPSRTCEGIFHQFGFSAHGFQLGPGVGALMAELITTGTTNFAISPFTIARFSAPRSVARAGKS